MQRRLRQRDKYRPSFVRLLRRSEASRESGKSQYTKLISQATPGSTDWGPLESCVPLWIGSVTGAAQVAAAKNLWLARSTQSWVFQI